MSFLVEPDRSADAEGGATAGTGVGAGAAGHTAFSLPLSGSFAGGILRVSEISPSSLSASHRERLTVGRSGLLTLVVHEGNRIVLSVRVIRSRFLHIDGQVGYRSDFEILEESIPTATRLLAERSDATTERDR